MNNTQLSFSEKKALKIISLNINPLGVITYSTLEPVMKTEEQIKTSHGKMALEVVKNGKKRFCSQYIELSRFIDSIQIVESPARINEIYDMLETENRQKAFLSLLDKGIIIKDLDCYKISNLSLLYPIEPYVYINVVQK